MPTDAERFLRICRQMEVIMLEIDRTKAKAILVAELGFSSFDADWFLRDYPRIHDELAEAVTRWLTDRTVLDVSVGGVTIKEVMQTRGDHFLMAVRLLNRLLDADVSPDQRERMARLLRRPVIRW